MPAQAMEISEIKALIFDVDGTLSDSDDRMVERIYDKLQFLRVVFRGKQAQTLSRWFVRTAEGPGN
jgi:phosphoglycolate phosphatase